MSLNSPARAGCKLPYCTAAVTAEFNIQFKAVKAAKISQCTDLLAVQSYDLNGQKLS